MKPVPVATLLVGIGSADRLQEGTGIEIESTVEQGESQIITRFLLFTSSKLNSIPLRSK